MNLLVEYLPCFDDMNNMLQLLHKLSKSLIGNYNYDILTTSDQHRMVYGRSTLWYM